MSDAITITAIISATVGFVAVVGLTTGLLGRRIDDVRDSVRDFKTDVTARFDKVDNEVVSVRGAVTDLGTRLTAIDGGGNR